MLYGLRCIKDSNDGTKATCVCAVLIQLKIGSMRAEIELTLLVQIVLCSRNFAVIASVASNNGARILCLSLIVCAERGKLCGVLFHIFCFGGSACGNTAISGVILERSANVFIFHMFRWLDIWVMYTQ